MAPCANCGAPLQPGAATCRYCGSAVVMQARPQQQWQAPPLQAAGRFAEPEPPFVLWAIVGFGLVFFFGAVLAIPGAILAIAAKNKWHAGETERAKDQLKLAKVLTIGGTVIGFVLWIGFFVLIALLGNM